MNQPVMIELLFAPGCKSREETWAMVKKVIAAKKLSAQVREILVTSPEQARQLKFPGSPSVRINGVDIEPAARAQTDYGMG